MDGDADAGARACFKSAWTSRQTTNADGEAVLPRELRLGAELLLGAMPRPVLPGDTELRTAGDTRRSLRSTPLPNALELAMAMALFLLVSRVKSPSGHQDATRALLLLRALARAARTKSTRSIAVPFSTIFNEIWPENRMKCRFHPKLSVTSAPCERLGRHSWFHNPLIEVYANRDGDVVKPNVASILVAVDVCGRLTQRYLCTISIC